MKPNRVVFAVLAALALFLPAHAQEKKEIQGYIAGGYVMAQGVASNYLNDGWNISGGALFRPAPHRPFAIRFDLGYSHMSANDSLVNKIAAAGFRVDDGYMSMGNLTAEALWEFGHPGHAGGWIGVGFGGYHRYLALTQTVISGGYICDPWWGWCYPGYVTGDAIAASDSLTKFGYSASFGFALPAGHGEFTFEARYHWMDTPQWTEYFPIMLGYRF